MSERACAACGADLELKRPHAKSCDGPCRAEAARLRNGKTPKGCAPGELCRECGDSLEGRRRGSLYCSSECKRQAARWRPRSVEGGEPLKVESETAPCGPHAVEADFYEGGDEASDEVEEYIAELRRRFPELDAAP